MSSSLLVSKTVGYAMCNMHGMKIRVLRCRIYIQHMDLLALDIWLWYTVTDHKIIFESIVRWAKKHINIYTDKHLKGNSSVKCFLAYSIPFDRERNDLQFFHVGPKLTEMRSVILPFSPLCLFSIYLESNFFKITKYKICKLYQRPVYNPPFDFFETLSL
jgi:hypothetical protein